MAFCGAKRFQDWAGPLMALSSPALITYICGCQMRKGLTRDSVHVEHLDRDQEMHSFSIC